MKYLLVTFLLMSFSFVNTSLGVEGKQRKEKGFIIPQEIALPVILHQPDCPLVFTQALLIHGIDGGGSHIYQVRNRGEKPIRSYSIATVTSAGTGNKWGGKGYLESELFLPGQVRPKSIEDWGIEIIPLTNEMRNRYKQSGQMKGIVIFMVVHVGFADGSIYDAEPVYKALSNFFEHNSIPPYQSPK